jgi:hypothetical protein
LLSPSDSLTHLSRARRSDARPADADDRDTRRARGSRDWNFCSRGRLGSARAQFAADASNTSIFLRPLERVDADLLAKFGDTDSGS